MKRIICVLVLVFISSAVGAADTSVRYAQNDDTATIRLKPEQTVAVYTKTPLRQIRGADVRLYNLRQIQYSVRSYQDITVRYDARRTPPLSVRTSKSGDSIAMRVRTDGGQYRLTFRTVSEPPYHRTVRLGESPPESVQNALIIIRVEPGQALDEKTWRSVEDVLTEAYPQKPYRYSITPYLGAIVLNDSDSGRGARDEIKEILKQNSVPFESHTF